MQRKFASKLSLVSLQRNKQYSMMVFMKALIIICVAVVLVQGDGNQPPIGVTVTQLYDLIKSTKVSIIDVRNPWELRQEGKIAGSVNIPGWQLGNVLSLPPEDFKKRYGIPLPAKDNCNLIFHCKSGGRSLKAVTLARSMGWYCSRHLLGGFNAWKEYYM